MLTGAAGTGAGAPLASSDFLTWEDFHDPVWDIKAGGKPYPEAMMSREGPDGDTPYFGASGRRGFSYSGAGAWGGGPGGGFGRSGSWGGAPGGGWGGGCR